MRRATIRAIGIYLALGAPAPAIAAEGLGLGSLLGSAVKNLGQVVQNKDALLGNYSEEQERAIGQGAAAVLLGAAPLLADDEIQRYVNRVGRWVALHSERPDLEWRFAVLDAGTFNAFATPGGYVFITRRLFELLRNEAELAGVLGHEIAHVVAKHHLRALSSKARMSLLADVAADAAGADGLAKSLVQGAKSLYSTGLDQGDELEADRMGIVLAARAGYEPYGLRHSLMTMQAAEGDGSAFAFFLSTHPATGKRMEAIDEAMTPALADAGGAAPTEPFGPLRDRLVRSPSRGAH